MPGSDTTKYGEGLQTAEPKKSEIAAEKVKPSRKSPEELLTDYGYEWTSFHPPEQDCLKKRIKEFFAGGDAPDTAVHKAVSLCAPKKAKVRLKDTDGEIIKVQMAGYALQDFTPAERACISSKISKLVKEGKDQKQAVAVAISVCAPSKSKGAKHGAADG